MGDNIVYSKEYIENIKMLLKQSVDEDDLSLIEEVIHMLDQNNEDDDFDKDW